MFGLFGNAPAAPQANTQPAAPAQPPVANPAPETQPVASSAPQQQPPASGLDTLWSIVRESQPGNPAAPDAPIDMAQLVQSQDFLTKVWEQQQPSTWIPADIRQQAEAGDAGALLKAMELATQHAFMAGMRVNGTLAGKAVGSTQQTLPRVIQDQVSAALQKQELASAAPQDAHPATAFILQSMAEQFMAKTPGTTPAAAMQMARTVLGDMASSIQPPSTNPAQPKAVNWDAFFGKEG